MQNKNFENGIIKTLPKSWTEDEANLCLKMRQEGSSVKEIAAYTNRSEISVSIKLKRLGKTNDKYNQKHRDDKYQTNQQFIDKIKPNSVLDLYAGNSFYVGKVKNLTTNDKDESFNTNFHEDAFKLLCKSVYENKHFDIVDLDPFGSAIDCVPLALNLAKKGLIITLGEMGHKRWKRLDFVRKWYNINSLEDFTTNNLIMEIKRLARCYGKIATPIFIKDYNRISRVWFELSELKTTEQWQRHEA